MHAFTVHDLAAVHALALHVLARALRSLRTVLYDLIDRAIKRSLLFRVLFCGHRWQPFRRVLANALAHTSGSRSKRRFGKPHELPPLSPRGLSGGGLNAFLSLKIV